MVALVVTIVVLLILAGISISLVLGNNGIVNKSKAGRTNYINASEEEKLQMAEADEWMDTLGGKRKWKQNATVVTNGKVTLNVGQQVEDYTGNNYKYWFVLGADEEGRLLITTKYNVGQRFSLLGQEDFVNAIDILNEKAETYLDSNMGDYARSIDMTDINKVTGYNPDAKPYNAGTEKANQWKNEVTYSLDATGKVHYQGTKWPLNDTTTEIETFTYWDGSNWKNLNDTEGKKVTITQNAYSYHLKNDAPTFNVSSLTKELEEAYELFFYTSGGTNSKYWIANQTCVTGAGKVAYGLFELYNNENIDYMTIYDSAETSISYPIQPYVKPVIALKPEVQVQVTSEGKVKVSIE